MSCRQSVTYDGSSIGIPFHDRMQSPIRNGDLRSLTSITTTSGIHVGVRIFFNERETTSVVKSQLDTTQDQGYNGDTVIIIIIISIQTLCAGLQRCPQCGTNRAYAAHSSCIEIYSPVESLIKFVS